jgi:hypothetical protein
MGGLTLSAMCRQKTLDCQSQLVVAHAVFIARPPIRAAGDDGFALQPIAAAVAVVRVAAKQEGIADEEATVMEVVEIVVVETMVEFMRGKSRTKTAADKLVFAVVNSQSTTAHVASSHRKTAAMATSTAAADKRDGTVMGSAENILKVRRTCRLSWPQHRWGKKQAAREGSHCSYHRSHDVFPF